MHQRIRRFHVQSGFFDSFDANEMGNGNGLRKDVGGGIFNMFVFSQLWVLLYIQIKLFLLFYLVFYICFLV